jgi:hypothetical protein
MLKSSLGLISFLSLFFLFQISALASDVNVSMNVTPYVAPATITGALTKTLGSTILGLVPLSVIATLFFASPRTTEDFMKFSVIALIVIALTITAISILVA